MKTMYIYIGYVQVEILYKLQLVQQSCNLHRVAVQVATCTKLAVQVATCTKSQLVHSNAIYIYMKTMNERTPHSLPLHSIPHYFHYNYPRFYTLK